MRSNTRYTAKLSIDNKDYFEDVINDLKMYDLVDSNNSIGIGNTCARKITFSINNPTENFENREVTLFIGTEIDNAIEYVQYGKYKVLKQTSEDSKYTYECYDKMAVDFEMGYFSKLAFPTTDKAVIEEICSQVGISMASTLKHVHKLSSKPEGYTRREMIGYLASLQGMNANINSEGNLAFKWYEDKGYILDSNRIYDGGITFGTSRNFVVNKLVCTVDNDNKITVGTGVTGISFENPFMTSEIMNELSESIVGFKYRPMSVKALGDIRLEAGDLITVKTGGLNYKVPVMQIETEYDGGISTVITASGKSETSLEASASGPMTKKMERYYSELLLVNEAMVNKLDVEQANIEYAKIGEVNAIKGRIDEFAAYEGRITNLETTAIKSDSADFLDLKAKTEKVDDLEAGITKTNTLIFGSATGDTIQTKFANSVIAVLGKAQIKDSMIDSLEFNKLTGIDINTSNLKIHSNDGNSTWTDNTIQITDDNKIVRVQIGKDSKNDYNIYVADKDGNVMFDALGITEKGIKNKVIRDDVVMDNANISASKLNIESLFNVVNNDKSHTFKSSKVFLDDKNQSLDVAFSSITESVDNANKTANNAKDTVSTVSKTVTSQGNEIKILKDNITNKIWQTDITTAVSSAKSDMESQLTTISNKYSELEQTVDGFSSTVSKVESIDSLVQSHTTQITQNANQIAAKVSSNGVISAINQSAEAVTISATKINLTGAVTMSAFNSSLKESINKIDNWTYANTTEIDGGAIRTGTIKANSIELGDFTNYATIDENNPNSLNADNIPSNLSRGLQIGYEPSIKANYINKKNIGDQYIFFCGYSNIRFKVGETLNASCTIGVYGDKNYNGKIGLWFYNENKNYVDEVASDSFVVNAWNWKDISIDIPVSKIPTTAKYFLIGLDSTQNLNIAVRQIQVRKKFGGNLIVDGSITADKLNVIGAHIGGWTIENTQLVSNNVQAWIPPTNRTAKDLRDIFFNGKPYNAVFDFNADGQITSMDALYLRRYLLGIYTLDDLVSKGYKPAYSNVNISLNPNSPNELLKISAYDSWGEDRSIVLGTCVSRIPTLSVDTIIPKENLSIYPGANMPAVEGGEINLISNSDSYPNITIDSYGDYCRIFGTSTGHGVRINCRTGGMENM